MVDSGYTPGERLTTGERVFRWSVVIGLLLFLLGFGLVVFLFLNGEITWQRSPTSSDQLYVIMERRQRGIGWIHTGAAPALAADGEVCTRTAVRYFMWLNNEDDLNATYCECYTETDAGLEFLGPRDCP